MKRYFKDVSKWLVPVGWFFVLLGLILFCVRWHSQANTDNSFSFTFSELWSNALVVGITAIIIMPLERNLAKKIADENSKAKLRDDFLYGKNKKRAVYALISKGWFTGKHFRGSYIDGGNFSDLKMLHDLDLQSSYIVQPCNFENSIFINANFRAACLNGSSFRGATLRGADLSWAHMDQCQFDSKTTLPDGSKYSKKTDNLILLKELMFHYMSAGGI